jgi:leucyl-tRNA synthetase
MQENWIGRSRGARFTFRFTDPARTDGLEVYTTRPDTLFGAAFVGVAADHPLAAEVAARSPEAAAFVDACRRGAVSEAEIETAEKLGFDTGLRVRHPFDPALDLPVWIANFILMDYGTGAIFGCPAHDQRDLDFARKYGLPGRPVVLPPGADPSAVEVGEEAWTGPGALFNSGFLDGLDIESAKAAAIARLEADDAGHFFSATHSAKGDRAKDCFAFQFFGHVSGYKSWSNSIHGHTSAGEFSGRTAG